MRVLVTGGTGYLGSAIVRALAARGHHAVVFSRHASTAGLPGVPIDGDIRDLSAVRGALAGADAVIHAAALVSVWHEHPVEFRDVNVGGLHNVIDAARALGIPRLVYTSSFLALPPFGTSHPLDANHYQRTKREARDVALAAAHRGTPIVTLYPGVVYGPGVATEGNLVGRLLHDHLAGRLPGIIGADRQWSFAYVDDVAEAHVAAAELLDAMGEYHVGGENAPPIRVFEIAQRITGVTPPRRIPVSVAYAIGAMEEMRARFTRRPPLLTRGAVEIFRHDWRMDSARSIRELNYRIRSLEAGVRAVLEAAG